MIFNVPFSITTAGYLIVDKRRHDYIDFPAIFGRRATRDPLFPPKSGSRDNSCCETTKVKMAWMQSCLWITSELNLLHSSFNIAVRIEEDSFGLSDGKEELKFIFPNTLKVRYLHILRFTAVRNFIEMFTASRLQIAFWTSFQSCFTIFIGSNMLECNTEQFFF